MCVGGKVREVDRERNGDSFYVRERKRGRKEIAFVTKTDIER